jgi:hypothetical protein
VFKPKIIISIFLLLPLLVIDCRCNREQIILKSVVLEIPSNAAGFSEKLDREKFLTIVKSAVAKNVNYSFDDQDQEGSELRFMVEPPAPSSKKGLLIFAILSKKDQEQIRDFKAYSDIDIVDGLVRGSDIGEAINKVLQNIYQLHRGLHVDNDLYLKKIEQAAKGQSIDHEELMAAIFVLGYAEEKKATPFLITLLANTSDLAMGNACLIALSDMAAQEAMPAIIEFVERKPSIIRRQGIIAAKRIASKLAAEWLLVMAYGHDDPMVRHEALVALKHVEAKLGL